LEAVRRANYRRFDCLFVLGSSGHQRQDQARELGSVRRDFGRSVRYHVRDWRNRGYGITITHTSSAAGDVDTATATALNSFTSDQPIEVVCSGASTDTAIAEVTIWVEPN
jgi:hypothetical protein